MRDFWIDQEAPRIGEVVTIKGRNCRVLDVDKYGIVTVKELDPEDMPQSVLCAMCDQNREGQRPRDGNGCWQCYDICFPMDGSSPVRGIKDIESVLWKQNKNNI